MSETDSATTVMKGTCNDTCRPLAGQPSLAVDALPGYKTSHLLDIIAAVSTSRAHRRCIGYVSLVSLLSC
jgi:hypothetical protein